ncbi:Uncharacterised protein [Mycobacteroides abscessus]|nr:Uncharacterised protein [Mycobacteroides abscessus]
MTSSVESHDMRGLCVSPAATRRATSAAWYCLPSPEKPS